MTTPNQKLVEVFAVANIRLLFPDVPVRTLGRAMRITQGNRGTVRVRDSIQKLRGAVTRVTIARIVANPLIEPLVDMMSWYSAEQFARRIRSYDDSQKGVALAETTTL